VPLQLENFFRTGLFGQGAALDCLLAALWYELNAGGIEQAAVLRTRRLLVALALVTAVYDLCIDFAYATLRMPTTVMVMLPQSLALVELFASCLISRQTFVLYRKMMAIGAMVESTEIRRHQRRLFSAGLLGAVSGFGSVIALAMAAIMWKSPAHFVSVNFFGVTCRMLNITAQLWYCSLGRTALGERLFRAKIFPATDYKSWHPTNPMSVALSDLTDNNVLAR
jgi:hypothetical protein